MTAAHAVSDRRDLSPDSHFRAGEAVESQARSYPRSLPVTVSKAQGIHLIDSRGQSYIDCLACAGALPLGHNHPEVNTAVMDYLQSGGPLQALDLMTPAKSAFIDALFGVLPAHWREGYRIQFCGPGGADAVEAATKLLGYATGRERLLAFQGAYHGMSQFALGLTGRLSVRDRLPGPGVPVQFLPYPGFFRSAFGRTEDEVVERSYQCIHDLLHDPLSGVARPAGMILELIQGEGGVNVAPAPWLRRIRELTHELGIPLVVDEIQTGFGRTGDFFAFEHAGIEPDVLVLSKALGGSFPLSVIVYRKELDVWPPGAHAGTFRGNQIAMVAGAKTIEILVRDGLCDHVRHVGALLRQGLEELRRQFAFVGDVRGRGLMLGVEVVSPQERDEHRDPTPAPALAYLLRQALLSRGLIVECGGRHGCVLRFLPPLILIEKDVEQILRILRAACEAVAKEGVA